MNVENVKTKVFNPGIVPPSTHIELKSLNFMFDYEKETELKDVPEIIQIMPSRGHIIGRDSREFNSTRPEEIVALFKAEGLELPIDINHSTEIQAHQGKESQAHGWIFDMVLGIDGSIWALVRWSKYAAYLIATEQYKYISPVFSYNQKTLEVIKLFSVALTNTPNLVMKALNTVEPTKQECEKMDKDLLALLGLAPEATKEEVETVINAMVTQKTEAEKALNAVKEPSLEKFVPRADYDLAVNSAKKVEEKLNKFLDEVKAKEIDVEIEKALNAKKISPATVDYYKSQCCKEGGLEEFKSFVEAAPSILQDVKLPDSPAVNSANTLTKAEKAVCKALNLTEEAFLESKKEVESERSAS